jgi:hypothetical protein
MRQLLVAALCLFSLAQAEDDAVLKPAEDNPLLKLAREQQIESNKKFNALADKKKLIERQLIALQNGVEAAQNSKEKAQIDQQNAKQQPSGVTRGDNNIDHRDWRWRRDQAIENSAGSATVTNRDQRAKADKDEVTADRAIEQKNGKIEALKKELEGLQPDYDQAQAEKKLSDDNVTALSPQKPKSRGAKYELVLKTGETINAISVIETPEAYTVKTEDKKFKTIPKSDVEKYHFEPDAK